MKAEDVSTAIELLISGNSAVVPVVAEHLRADSRYAAALDGLSDELKIQILQQFFWHVVPGTHKTSFDQRTVSALLRRWYGIELAPDHAPEFADHPGRALDQIYHLKFGDTRIFLYLSELKISSAERLVDAVANQAVLTTEVTSPPCELAEFVPLWLQNREHEPDTYYLAGRDPGHPIQEYFDQQLTAISSALGVTITQCSTEMAIIANGDALRFHRDRLVNQYKRLNESNGPADGVQVVQDLTLIDWDMQPGTISGTALDHPDGDRYLFLLRPSEVVGLFFAELPKPPGPLMMPYHCALPVYDFAASATVGPARGKRLSTLIRGLAPEDEVTRLTDMATELSLDCVEAADDGCRIYPSGVRVVTHSRLPETALVPVNLIPGAAEGVSITELSVDANASLLRTITAEMSLNGYRFFRIDKHGEGFSDLNQVLPSIADADKVVIINRSLHGPQRDISFPVAFDYTQQGMPWIQLFRLHAGDVVSLPRAAAPMLRLTPTDHLLHRSAPLDSFYPLPVGQPRLANIVEMAFR